MSKYYVPTIKEFHIGFEYEVAYRDPEYDKKIITSTDDMFELENKLDNTKNYSYRVKYLDKEDIESLGWKLIEEGNLFIEFEKTLRNVNYKLTFCTKDLGRIVLSNEHNMFIDITIKNKSEFKKLMQQSNITT